MDKGKRKKEEESKKKKSKGAAKTNDQDKQKERSGDLAEGVEKLSLTDESKSCSGELPEASLSDESKSCSGELPEASLSDKQLKNVLDTMWNTVLYHGYGYSSLGGSLAKTTHLVCKIDSVPKTIIKENDEDTHEHAEHILIKYLEKENVVTQNDEGIHADKNLQDNLEEKPFIPKKITVYINNSPCAACAKELKDYLEKNQDIHLTLYVTHLYMIKRKSCQDRADEENESHMTGINDKVHERNYQGLRNLLSLRDNRCKIEAFTKDVWRELHEVMGLNEYFQQRISTYDTEDTTKSHDRSRKSEDVNVKLDLIHLQADVDPWHGIKK